MNSDAQLEAIAVACGWTWLEQDCDYVLTGIAPNCSYRSIVSPYLWDLNTMHEAEKTLTENQREEYAANLCDEVGENPDDRMHFSFPVLHATAAQRAEAFLRTIGKWVDHD